MPIHSMGTGELASQGVLTVISAFPARSCLKHDRHLREFARRVTLEYLQQKIGSLVGEQSAVVVIHGGIAREARRDPRCRGTARP